MMEAAFRILLTLTRVSLGRKENGIREGEASAVCEIVMALVINEL